MPPASGRKSRRPRDGIDYGPLEDQGSPKPAECKPAIKISSLMRDSKPFKYSVLIAIGIGVAFAVFFFGVTIAIIARAIATDNTGFEPDNPDFVLYKNSRFKGCYNLAPDATNCSHIRSGISTHATSLAEGFGYMNNIRLEHS